MTAPGFAPRPSNDVLDRIALIEKRLRNMQQNIAGATVAGGGAPLASATQIPHAIGTPMASGTGTASARYDHVHTSTLAAQQDVSATTPSSGQILVYNTSLSKWQNTNRTLAGDSDVSVSSPTANQALVYNGTTWSNQSVVPVGMFSRYTTTSALGTAGTWAILGSFALAEGSGTGLTPSGGNSWLLGPGIWRVHTAIITNQPTILGLNSSTSTSSMASTLYAADSSGATVGGWAACNCFAEIRSPVGAPVTVAVAAYVSATASYVSSNCRLTFDWSPL